MLVPIPVTVKNIELSLDDCYIHLEYSYCERPSSNEDWHSRWREVKRCWTKEAPSLVRLLIDHPAPVKSIAIRDGEYFTPQMMRVLTLALPQMTNAELQIDNRLFLRLLPMLRAAWFTRLIICGIDDKVVHLAAELRVQHLFINYCAFTDQGLSRLVEAAGNRRLYDTLDLSASVTGTCSLSTLRGLLLITNSLVNIHLTQENINHVLIPMITSDTGAHIEHLRFLVSCDAPTILALICAVQINEGLQDIKIVWILPRDSPYHSTSDLVQLDITARARVEVRVCFPDVAMSVLWIQAAPAIATSSVAAVVTVLPPEPWVDDLGQRVLRELLRLRKLDEKDQPSAVGN